MDQYIELFAVYWVDWQQTAIANTRYTVVLATSAFLIGTFIISLLKALKIANLNKQLLAEQKQVEQLTSSHEELLNQHKTAEEQITSIQQQLSDTSDNFEKEKQQYQSDLIAKDKLLSESSTTHKRAIETLSSTLNEETQRVNQLQSDLNEQKENITQFTQVQTELNEIKQQKSQVTLELESVKNKLEAESNNNNEISKHLHNQENLVKRYMDKAAELEQQLETKHIDAEIELPNLKQETDNIQLEPKIQVSEPVIEAIIEPTPTPTPTPTPAPEPEPEPEPEYIKQDSVKTIEKTTKKPAVKKGGVLSWFKSLDNKVDKTISIDNNDLQKETSTDQPESANSEERNTVEIEPIQIDKPLEPEIIVKEEPSPVLEKPTVSISKQDTAKKSGAVGGVFGWFKSIDEKMDKLASIGDDTPKQSAVDQQNPPSSIEEIAFKEDPLPAKSQAEPVTIIEKKKQSSVQEKPSSPINNTDEVEVSFSEKLAEVADKMDSIQGKFKGFFNKKR